jgi:hypothetical protein
MAFAPFRALITTKAMLRIDTMPTIKTPNSAAGLAKT